MDFVLDFALDFTLDCVLGFVLDCCVLDFVFLLDEVPDFVSVSLSVFCIQMFCWCAHLLILSTLFVGSLRSFVSLIVRLRVLSLCLIVGLFD